MNDDPADPGPTIWAAGVDPSWGLHIIDVDPSMGRLIDILARQSDAFAADRQNRSASTSR